MDSIINQMKNLGLTEYEVKAYLTLLQKHPINGYLLSKNSGVPRSRIYEVLDGLKKKQIVFEQSEGKSISYIPLEPSLLVKKLRQDFENTIESVDSYTTKLYNSEKPDLEPRILRGRNEIINMIKVLIRDAKKRVALSIWDEEYVAIKDELDKIRSKGILIRGMYFGSNNPYTELVSHRRIERYIAENDERYIIAIVDDMHVISGIISRGEDSQVTWSNDPGIVQISDDFIAHDVMLNTYNTFLESKQRAIYERTLDKVRKEYHGFTDEEFELFPVPEIEE